MNQVATVSAQPRELSVCISSSKVTPIAVIAVCALLAGIACFAFLPQSAALKPFSAIVVAQSSIMGAVMITLAKRRNNVAKAWTYGYLVEGVVLFAIGTLLG